MVTARDKGTFEEVIVRIGSSLDDEQNDNSMFKGNSSSFVGHMSLGMQVCNDSEMFG